MKRLVLMVIPALICGLMFKSCGSDKADTKDDKTIGELYAMGSKSTTVLIGDKGKLDLLFTGENIKSFNVETGEIVFIDLKTDDIEGTFGLYTTVYFFLNDKPLFDPPIKIQSGVSSFASNDLELRLFGEDGIRLWIFYASFDWYPDAEREVMLKEKEENSKKRQKQLDVLIEYLRGAGKIVE